jgi:hypothetical protein
MDGHGIPGIVVDVPDRQRGRAVMVTPGGDGYAGR